MEDSKKELLKALGFNKEVENVEGKRCPFCGREIKMEDFRDPLSLKEYHISGLCQACQDEMFGK